MIEVVELEFFYKETLPLRIRDDLSFDEVIVSELIFGRKKYFTVLYRNPQNKAQSDEFTKFLVNVEELYLNIKEQNAYAMFFAGISMLTASPGTRG